MRRLFWLLIIGLPHAYPLWAGDILSFYAVTATLVALGVFLFQTPASAPWLRYFSEVFQRGISATAR